MISVRLRIGSPTDLSLGKRDASLPHSQIMLRVSPYLARFGLGLALIIFLLPQTNAAQQNRDVIAPPPPGKMIDLGGYRLHINCTGKGTPAVVMVAGGGDFSFDWSLVQPGISSFGRVCSYDRAGDAWSDPGPFPRTMRQEAFELHLLLKNAGVGPPYVLVGHSIGGLIVRLFAEQYPQEVAGMVLVSPTHEDTTLSYRGKIVRMRTLSTGKTIPPPQTMKSHPPQPASEEDIKSYEAYVKAAGVPRIGPPYDQLPPSVQALRRWAVTPHYPLYGMPEDFGPEELQAMYEANSRTKYPLGDIPLLVLIQLGKGENKPPPGVLPEEWKRLDEEKKQQKLELSRLSRNGKAVFVENSSHHIQLDRPDAVISAVHQVFEAARRVQEE
jgi:pimeloyl-ACP methyl ester carboxylesterase